MTREEDDDEDDEPATIVKRKPSKKRPRQNVIRSFDVEEEDVTIKKKTKKDKRKKGLGFGGAPALVPPEDEKEEEENEPSSLYNKDALAALKSKQSFRQQENLPETKKIENVVAAGSSKEQPRKQQEESFIALNDSHGEPVSILTGADAEATLLDTEQDSKPPPSTTEVIPDDDESDWEAQVTKRAGLNPAPSKRKTTPRNTKSLDDLRDQLSSTLSTVQTRNDDIQSAFNRRRVEVHAADDQVQEHQRALLSAGEALEYYQELRLNITNHVGALRALREKLQPLQEARRQVSSMQSGRMLWTEWENDVVAVLRPEVVLGRQPPADPQETAEMIVDEFGRDMKSQHVMAREKRLQQRETARRQGGLDGSDPGQILLHAEREEVDQRLDALQEALSVALEEMDDSYTSLEHLLRLFREWSTKYAQEYQSCHAGMSLADLASVLIQVDLLSSHYPLAIKSSFPNLDILKEQQEQVTATVALEETTLYRTVDKVLIPVFQDVLPHYNIHSTHETKSMTLYYTEVQKLLPTKNILMSQLSHQVIDHLTKGLNDLCIPVVSNTAFDDDNTKAVVEATEFATQIQVTRIQTIVSNLFTYWIPLLQQPVLTEAVLDFLSSPFLSLVSSFGNEERTKSEMRRIWGHVEPYLLEPEYMVAMAPLQAAATVYELTDA